MLLNCGVGQDSWESLELQGDPTSPFWRRSFGRNDAKAETPVLWPPDLKSWLIGEDADAGKDWRQEEKGTTEDKIAGWHHRFSGREFEQALELVMDREAWRAAVHGAAEDRLGDWTDWRPLVAKWDERNIKSCPVPNPSQHQSLFQWVNSSHEVARVLEFQL